MTKKQKSLPSNDRLRDKNCIDKNCVTQLLTDLNNNVKTKPDYLPECLKRAKATNPKKLEWLTAICPICGKEYPYLPIHNPGYCERVDCLYELANERLKEKEVKRNENNL